MGVAAVHCVIVGFSLQSLPNKLLYEYTEGIGEDPIAVSCAHINAYLTPAPDVFIPRRSKPICDVPEMKIGNKPIDGGNFLFTTDERDAFLAIEPGAKPYFHRFLGAEEFINRSERWCLDRKSTRLIPVTNPHLVCRIILEKKKTKYHQLTLICDTA